MKTKQKHFWAKPKTGVVNHFFTRAHEWANFPTSLCGRTYGINTQLEEPTAMHDCQNCTRAMKK